VFSGSGPLFEIAGIAFGLREGVIALIALVALYMLVVVLRMRRLQGRKSVPLAAAPTLPEAVVPVAPPSEPAEQRVAPVHAPVEDVPETYSARAVPGGNMTAAQLEELVQLREELDAVRGELAALRQEMYQELEHLRAAQTVSPIYGDAMQMAVSGYDAAMIAERCGIARAEAELVVALANSREQ
jgi:hypothetical protein